MDDRDIVNMTRHRRGQKEGHYESFFQRANHPERPEAFWIRYTIFQHRKHPEKAEGELWAVHFDGESGNHTAAKLEVPISFFDFSPAPFNVRIGDATLVHERLRGAAETDGRFLSWDLAWKGDAPILYFLPHALYEAKLPKAKSVVAWPQARFDGKMIVGEREVEVAGWPGSQNHNWGSKHTDTYAWGQVVGFDGAPDTFFEAITAQVKLGPFKTPWLTVIAVRHEGKEYLLNTIGVARKAKAEWRFFEWDLENENADIHVRARITANKADFVGLDYRNPPGGSHTCLNSKIARCELTLTPKGGSPVTLKSRHRAAFEILTDDPSHGVPVVV